MASKRDDTEMPLTVVPSRIERGNLHDEVVTVLRERIIQDELPPGTRIQETELCQQFGISRTPLREAIRVLVAEGLITLLPRRGAVVATPSQDEIQGLFYALGAIESVCAPIACVNFSDEDIAFIEREHAAMVDHHAHRRVKDYYRTNQSIHERIVKGAGNSFLIELHRSLGIPTLTGRLQSSPPTTMDHAPQSAVWTRLASFSLLLTTSAPIWAQCVI